MTVKKRPRLHHHAANKIRQLFVRGDRGTQPRYSEQANAETDAQDAGAQSAGNKPPGEQSDGGNRTNHGGNQERPREPREKRLREWLLVVFTGAIVAGTLYYASVAKRQADVMSQQRDVMIQQVNASQRQVEESQKQTNTFDKTLTEAQKSANAAVRSADSGEQSAAVAQQGLEVSAQSMAVGSGAWLSVQGASLRSTEKNRPVLEVGRPIFVEVDYVNSGHSPALDVRLKFVTDIRDIKAEAPPQDPNFPLSAFPKRATTVGPGVVIGSWDMSNVVLDEPTRLNLETKQSRLYVQGVILYKDIFKKQHRTSFCLFYKPPATNLEDCGGKAK